MRSTTTTRLKVCERVSAKTTQPQKPCAHCRRAILRQGAPIKVQPEPAAS